MASSHRFGFHPSRRVSQVPRSSLRWALSPVTPGKLDGCFSFTSPSIADLPFSGWLAAHHPCNEAETSSLALRLPPSLRKASYDRSLCRTLPSLHVGMSNSCYMASTFHLAGKTRLSWRTRGHGGFTEYFLSLIRARNLCDAPCPPCLSGNWVQPPMADRKAVTEIWRRGGFAPRPLHSP